MVYQLVTLNNLWPSSSYEDTAAEADDELLGRMVSHLGRMPQALRERWSNRAEYVNEEGEELPDVDEDGEPLGAEEEGKRRAEEVLGEVLRRQKPVGMGEGERAAFEGFLRGCLVWEEGERETAGGLLRGEWLVGEWDEEDGNEEGEE